MSSKRMNVWVGYHYSCLMFLTINVMLFICEEDDTLPILNGLDETNVGSVKWK